MRILLLLAQLFALGYPTPPPPPPIFQPVQQGPLPSHRHGPHEGEPGAVCYRGETRRLGGQRSGMLYHCDCKFICDVGAAGEPVQREDDDCETSCAPPDKPQCSCHEEEACERK